MFYIYILENENKKHYIGYTSKRPEDRVIEHNRSKGRWTRHKGPWKIVYFEGFNTKEDAYKREKQIKSYKGGRAFKKLIEHWEGWPSGCPPEAGPPLAERLKCLQSML